MKLKFKKQEFQEEAVKSTCDVFEGQSKETFQYILGKKKGGLTRFGAESNIYAWKNGKVVLTEDNLLENIQKIQRRNDIPQSKKLEGSGLNLTVEMETGTGKTFVYINTIFEMNKRYGWSKFIVVVPSIAIREGVAKSFQMMEDHFATLYGKKIRHFIFDSSKPTQIENFATSNGINVMIINNHAFNKSDTNNMYKKTEKGAKLIDYISGTNPIIIIDEPQSVEGAKTKLALKDFNALFTLRYSATHRDIYNMIYRLDAIDAFNKKLVKKINVKGIDIKGTTATHSYLYLEGIDISKTHYPKARIEIEVKQKEGIKKKTVKVTQGDDLFSDNFSKGLNEYKGFKVSEINANSNSVRFTNGIILTSGEVTGDISEDYKRRIQIRETIRSHLHKEKNLFKQGIKVISLFFIDEVKNYREYDDEGNETEGKYVKIFEEEYEKISKEFQKESKEYLEYLKSITSKETHEGYFSIDKKGKLINPKETGRGENKTCNDVSAYDLIMKKKELLLDLKNNVRFIFSHSALREGWDNPNVFQICVLRNTDPKEVRTRQEVGRGLRLCVNQNGERVDEEFEGLDFTQANILTIIANESYEKFAHGLQTEFSKNIRDRPTKLTVEFLTKRKIEDTKISLTLAKQIYHDFIKNEYLDENDNLTEKYHEDLKKGEIKVREDLEKQKEDIIEVVKELYENKVVIDNEDDFTKLRNKMSDNFNHPEFKKLWECINSKSTYTVEFDTRKLIKNSIEQLNDNLHISRIIAEVKSGSMKRTALKSDDFKNNKAFSGESTSSERMDSIISDSIKYDLIGKIVSETSLTRNTIIEILTKIESHKFNLYKQNPEDFISQVSKIINDEKAEVINENVVYHKTGEKIPINIFEKGILHYGKPVYLNKFIYDYLISDSNVERDFALDVDNAEDLVSVFAKLPRGDYVIYTPVGKFSPDWVIVFDKKKVKYVYFVVETKGSSRQLDLRGVERIKIKCAKKHFEVISDKKVKFDAVSSFDELRDIIEIIS